MAVDVGSAVGYLDLDISGFLSGLRSAQSEADSVSKNIGQTLSGIGDSMSKIGGIATAGLTVPIVTAVTTSVKQFANLEQSIGGVETLFKQSADTVIKNAERAYKAAGVDANSYMEQVTSFSATLLQGLSGDTEKAAEYADKAIIDMSDNANKMGTNISLIQNAYQGFAKDNYTMLDNLKLGYGGTAGEMARLVNESGVLGDSFEATAENVKEIPFDTLIEAIHVTQENLDITGTTSKEAAETVSGSFQMAKSSVLNFLQQLGNPGADMDKFADEMIKSIGVFVQNVKRVLLTIWDNLPISPLQKKLLVAAAAFGPIMLATGKVISIVGGLFTTFSKLTSVFAKLAPAASSAATATAGAGTAAAGAGAGFAAVLGPILAIIAAIAVLVAAFANLWKNNEEFRNKMTEIWDGIKSKFESFAQGIVDRLNALGFDFENITEVLKAIWDGFCQFLAPIFEAAFEIISSVLGTVMDVLTGILDVFIGLFTGNWEQCWEGIKGILKGAWDGIVGILSAVGNMLFGLFETILGWFGTSWDECWTSIKDFFVNIWNSITSFFTNMINAIKTGVSNFITSIINFFAQLPTNIKNFITDAWNAVVTWATNMVTKAREMGQNFLNAIVEFFTDLPYKIGYFIGSALANIVSWVTNMVAKAREMGTNFLNAIVEFFTQLPGKIRNFITSAWNNVKQWVTDMGNSAREMGTNFINNVVSFFTQLPGKILNFITSALNNIKTWVTNTANQAREMGTQFISNVVSFMTQLPGKIKQFLDSAIDNLKTWVTQMGRKGKKAVQSLINNVVSAASGIADKVKSIGSDIVSGVWNGIKAAKDTFVSNVKSFFSGIVDGVKDTLGIHSPSKVMEDEVGKNIALGVIEGIKKKEGDVKKTASEMAQIIVDAASKQWERYNLTHKTTIAEEVAFWNEIKNECKKGTDAYYDALKKYKDANKSLNDSIKSVEDNYKQSWAKIKENLKNDIQEVTDLYNEKLISRTNEIKGQLGNLFSAYTFEETKDTAETLKSNLQSQVDALNDWNTQMNALSSRQGIGDDFLQEVRDMGVGATQQVKILNSMTDEELNNYLSLWKQKNEEANNIAKEELVQYKEECEKQVKVLKEAAHKELKALEKEYVTSLKSLGVKTKNESKNIGVDIVKGLEKGIKSQNAEFSAFLTSYFQRIVSAAKAALGIHSPSKVFAEEVGKWLPAGMAEGFASAMPSTMKAIQEDLNKGINNIDTDDISAGTMVSGFADKLKLIYNDVALWFESIESRIGNSVDSMTQSLDMLIRVGHVIVNSDGTLGYIGYNGFTKSGGSEGYVDRTNPKDKDTGGNGDTFIFNSPKAIDEIEAAKQMKKTKQDMAEGF